MVAHNLAQFPLFQGLKNEDLQIIAPLVTQREFQRGALVFEQNSPAKYFYVMISGEVEITFKPYDGPAMTVARVAPGGVFGWSAAMGHETYTSSAVCMTPCCVYRMEGARLHRLCKDFPGAGDVIMERLAGVIADRLRRGHTGICNVLSRAADE
jgi:CRP-like cAMP-binding protein